MGRPPKSGARTPSGQLSRAKAGRVSWQSHIAHLRRMHDSVMLDATRRVEFEWQLGRLYLRGKLAGEFEDGGASRNDQRYAAGRKYLELVNEANRCMGIPPATPQGQDLTRVHGRPLTDDEDADRAARDRKTLSRYYAAEASIGPLNSLERSVVYAVVVKDSEPVTDEARLALRRGLQRLAEHFRRIG